MLDNDNFYTICHLNNVCKIQKSYLTRYLFYAVQFCCKTKKGCCTSHRIHEETLDERVWNLVSVARDSRAEELKKLARMQKM